MLASCDMQILIISSYETCVNAVLAAKSVPWYSLLLNDSPPLRDQQVNIFDVQGGTR